MRAPIHVYNSRIPRWLKVDAITLYPYIYYREQDPSAQLMLHEVTHFFQVAHTGWFRFYISYLMYYIAGRIAGLDHYTAYLEIPWEVAARMYSGEDS